MNEENSPAVDENEPPEEVTKPAVPVTKSKATLTRDAKGKPKDIKGALNVMCSPRVTGTMFDTARQVRIPASGQNPVAVADVTAGSWLWCQIDAGLVIKVGK